MAAYIKLSLLRPTQLTLGFREVARRQARFMALNTSAQKSYVADRPVPCVIGPTQEVYLVDRHHMCRVLMEAGVTEVRHDVICDAKTLGPVEFWRFMDLRRWVHPFDADGRRCDVSVLPGSVADLVDDPYRALAGDVRRANGFEKDDSPFEEFIWADFLRFRISRKELQSDFAAASARAVTLARSTEARHLPGWNGKG